MTTWLTLDETAEYLKMGRSTLYRLAREGRMPAHKRGHWIPAPSLAYGQTLDFVLKHRHDDHEQFRKVSARLWQYFSYNETGEIED